MALKTVLITGCSEGGIGSALVETFHERNLHVFATARKPSQMSHLEHLPHVTLLSLDVTSSPSIAAAVQAVEGQTGGKLDYLVNNAGSWYMAPTLDVDIEQGKKMFDVNLWGVIAVTQAFAPLMMAAGGVGTIVNISSVSGCVRAPWSSVYGASKAALAHVGEVLRLEMAPFGINVVTVVTGTVESRLFVNGPEVKLPPTSPYLAVERNVIVRAKGEDIGERMKAKEYATKVVRDILGGANGLTYRGRYASIVRFLTYLPTSWFEGFLFKAAGLNTLSKRSEQALGDGHRDGEEAQQ